MAGGAWIIDLHNISEHFAFWARSLTSLENVFLIFLALQCKIQGIFLAKKVVGHNFWTEGPTDLRWTSLSYIFDALFGDTPLGHIFFAPGIPGSDKKRLKRAICYWQQADRQEQLLLKRATLACGDNCGNSGYQDQGFAGRSIFQQGGARQGWKFAKCGKRSKKTQ